MPKGKIPKEIKKTEEVKIHFSKYISGKKINKYIVAAVGAKANKKDLKTIKEWDAFFEKIINMRLR